MPLSPPQPPQREPYYSDVEMYGWARRDCAINLIATLARWCNPPVAFKGNAAGRIWHFIGDYKDRAQLLFTTEEGAGTIELTIADNDWVRADVFMGEALILRAWIEDPYEEKEFWPDNGDGVGEAPGRISKRGRWLQIETARFPGAASSTTGFWIVEDASD